MNELISKKFILAVMAVISSSLLVYLGKVDDGVYATVMVATVGAFLAADVAEKITTPTGEKS